MLFSNPLERVRAAAGRLPFITGAAVVLVLVGLGLLAFSLGSSPERPLYPTLPTFTLPAGTVDYEATEIGFADLNADPAAYQGRRIQVTGVYTPVEAPECLDYVGPSIRWSLVAEELQLNATGFENVLRLVDEGIDMTVTGIWQAYRGPVGCGKEPADGTVWYLAVDRILEPNPLTGEPGVALTVIPGSPLPTLSPLETVETPTITETATIEDSGVVTATVAPEATLPVAGTPTTDATPLPVTPLVTPGTPTATTGTPDQQGTPNATTTVGTPTPTATGGAQGTTTPGLPTNTPSGTGYPSQATPTATTTGGYP